MLGKHKLFYHISVLFNCKKIFLCGSRRLLVVSTESITVSQKDTSHCIFTQSIINDNFSLCPILQLFHIYNSHNPSGRTVALKATQSLTEMSTRNISGGQRWPVRTPNNLTTFPCLLSRYLSASSSWKPMGLIGSVQGLFFPYLYILIY